MYFHRSALGGGGDSYPTVKNNFQNLTHEELAGHMAWLKSFAAALVRDPNEADDLVQDAFQVFAGTRTRVGDVRGFLAGTVRFLSMKEKRKAARRKGREEVVAQARSLEDNPPSDALERMDIMRAVLEEIRELPQAQARAIGMRYLDGSDTSEIAQREGVAPQTVRANLTRGLQALRERLDRRFGSRDLWSTVLVPWALPIPTGIAPVGGESQVPLSASNASGTAAASTSAILSTGVLLVTLKATALVLVPAACIAIWAASRPSAAPKDIANESGPVATADAELATLDESKTRNLAGENQSAGEPAQAKKPAEPAEDVTAQVEQFAFAGRAVDRLTGEPIPSVGLSLTVYHEGGQEKSFVGHTTTKADGTFVSDKVAPSTSKAVVLIQDKATEESYDFLADYNGPFPFEGDLAVEIGPTVELVYASGPFDPTVAYRVQAPGMGMREYPQTTVVRTNPAPWVRFVRPLDQPSAKGPWPIRVLDEQGLLEGTGTLDAAYGIQAEPVKIDFAERGAIAFELGASSKTAPHFLKLTLEGPDAGEPTRVSMGKTKTGWAGEAKWLAPGNYRWTCLFGEESHSGAVQVNVNQVAQVDLPAFGENSVQVHVLLDATEFPKLDLGAYTYFVFNQANMKDQVSVSPTRVEGGQPGMWEIVHEGLPAAEWMIAVQVDGGYEAENALNKILFGEEPLRIKIKELSVRDVTLEVLDAATGQPIPNAVAIHMNGMQVAQVESDGQGGFEPVAVSNSNDTSFFVSAPGYQLTEQVVEQASTEPLVTISLQKGWRSRVLVIDMEKQAPLANVEVSIDGKSVGRTSLDGSLWFEGEGPPKLIEVAQEDQTLEVIHSPFESGKASGPSEFGYPFLVRPQ